VLTMSSFQLPPCALDVYVADKPKDCSVLLSRRGRRLSSVSTNQSDGSIEGIHDHLAPVNYAPMKGGRRERFASPGSTQVGSSPYSSPSSSPGLFTSSIFDVDAMPLFDFDLSFEGASPRRLPTILSGELSELP
jgi:hypothetical protein